MYLMYTPSFCSYRNTKSKRKLRCETITHFAARNQCRLARGKNTLKNHNSRPKILPYAILLMNEEYKMTEPHAPLALLKYLKKPLLSFLNWLKRPNLQIRAKSNTITYTDEKGKQLVPRYPGFLITNKSKNKLHIDLSKLYINDQIYQGVTDKHTAEAKKSDGSIDCDNEAVKRFHPKRNDPFELAPFADAFIPYKVLGTGVSNLSRKKSSTKVFNEKGKLIIKMSINGKEFEYGIKLLGVYPVFLNYLAHYDPKHDT